VASAAATIFWPLAVWLITGSASALGVIYGVEALLGLIARHVARSMGLPAWSASESYIGRLRRWRTARRDLWGRSSASPPF
jgi:hypothetical protein